MSTPTSTPQEKDTDDNNNNNNMMDGLAPRDEEAGFKESTVPPWRFWAVSVGLCLGLFLAMLDSSIVATSLLAIGEEFREVENINWVALAYSLAYLGCAVMFSRLTDVVGRRDAFLGAFFVFFAFSLGCGFAQSLNQLIAFRALQGVGGSGLYSITMIVWAELAPDHLKQYIAGLIGVVIAVAGVMGPVLGGILTHYASWRWVFWINGPIGAASMAVFFFTWPNAKYLPDLERRSWKTIDFLGTFLLIAAAVLVTFTFQNASRNTKQWGSAVFLVPLIVGIFCWFGLFLWEWWVERRWGGKMLAAFPLQLLRNRVYSATLINDTMLGFAYIMIIYAVPMKLQVVNGKSALVAGIMLLPLLGGVAIGSPVAGFINKDKNRFCETIVVASCLMLLGCGLETTLSDSYHLQAKALGFLVLIGFGFGLSAAPTTMIAMLESPIHEHAPSQGIIAQFRILGGSLGIAASSAILAVQTEKAGLSPHAVQGSTGPSQAVRTVYAEAFTQDLRVCTIVMGVGVLAALAPSSTLVPSPPSSSSPPLLRMSAATRTLFNTLRHIAPFPGLSRSTFRSSTIRHRVPGSSLLSRIVTSPGAATAAVRMSSSTAAAKRLQGKTVLITGASSGIGKSTALEFARTAPQNGLKVVLTARRVEALRELAAQIDEETSGGVKVLPVRLDISKPDEVRGFVGGLPEEFRDIDVLVNNAGLVKGVDKAPEIKEEDINVMFATNVTGLINMTQQILPIFLKKGSEGGAGDIINVGSIAGRDPYPGGSIYCATKAAVRSFTESLRKELIATRVRVIEIDPGQVETVMPPFFSFIALPQRSDGTDKGQMQEFSVVRFYGDKSKADAVYAGCDPLTPDDIAEVIVFAATRRENVVIADTLIFPQHQGSAGMVHRKSNL
ncbi:uncharacterized protein E0L32_004893 [Thyridium curvatum]|uniref:Major facilitator superfamily (MFS) profile domain-containing protein n=1 Tax=Thyridium curvatum TaxID=1093900 RepID=A0A507B5H0_9PEZI|nr:uncharacterized protein E0L32_004893 [Thyridium curvatum]TPX15063.1 hypothetical protein E0L32_004893 [Thyridium curvatum]